MEIISNLATSIDGKIAPRDSPLVWLGTKADRSRMQELRAQADAILIGANTLRIYKKPCTTTFKSAGKQPINAVVSTDLSGLSPTWEFFRSKKIQRILFATVPIQNNLTRLIKSSEIVILNSHQYLPAATQIIKYLESRGVKTLLIEGGGTLMWQFVRLNLIDRYYVTLTPWAIGGATTPTLIDGEGFRAAKMLPLKLVEHKVVGNEIFLVYEKPKGRGKNEKNIRT